MGAAASIELLYKDAFTWFKAYVDTETYIDDFGSIDKDADGSISYLELMTWLKNKAKSDSGYNVFGSNPQVVSIAHKNASRKAGNGEKIVTLTEFRVLLVQLFATSVLWSHFNTADNWAEGDDVGNKQLNFEEFKLACQTLCKTHAGEVLTDDQIREDFIALDTNNSDSIGFMEVCNHCYKYVDLAIVPQSDVSKVSPLMDIVGDLQEGASYLSLDEKNASAVSALNDKLAHETNSAIDFIENSTKTATTPGASPTKPVQVDEAIPEAATGDQAQS